VWFAPARARNGAGNGAAAHCSSTQVLLQQHIAWNQATGCCNSRLYCGYMAMQQRHLAIPVAIAGAMVK
jgi:hypothetical protein